MQFAVAHLALSRTDSRTGKTRLQTLLEIKEQLGIVAPELSSLPPLPNGVEYLWTWFCSLSYTRDVDEHGFRPITWKEKQSYFSLCKIAPNIWELEVLAQLDDAFLRSHQKSDVIGTITSAKSLITVIGKEEDG